MLRASPRTSDWDLVGTPRNKLVEGSVVKDCCCCCRPVPCGLLRRFIIVRSSENKSREGISECLVMAWEFSERNTLAIKMGLRREMLRLSTKIVCVFAKGICGRMVNPWQRINRRESSQPFRAFKCCPRHFWECHGVNCVPLWLSPFVPRIRDQNAYQNRMIIPIDRLFSPWWDYIEPRWVRICLPIGPLIRIQTDYDCHSMESSVGSFNFYLHKWWGCPSRPCSENFIQD